MGKILEFKKVETEQTCAGEAICMQCKHEWVATSPTGAVSLECPSCHTIKGHFKYQCSVSEGELLRVCNCGNDLFRITPTGHLCANCGIYQEYD